MQRISNQRFARRVLLLAVTALLSCPLINPSYGEELPNSLQQELDAISARLQQMRKAGETQLADQQEERLRQTLQNYGKSIERSLAAAIDARKSPVEKSLEVARKEIDRLRNDGDEQTATELEKLLVPIQEADKTGQYDFKTSDAPELHLVTVSQGSTLPEEYTVDNDRLSHGRVEP